MTHHHKRNNNSNNPNNQNKPKQKLENIIGNLDFKEMTKLAERFNCSIQNIVCGYLHQPINYVDDVASQQLYVTGTCSLDYRKCGYNAPVTSPSVCEVCPLYQKIFDYKP